MSHQKKKVSAFEYAIMSIADPEGAKECEPFTQEEERRMREERIVGKITVIATNMKRRHPSHQQ